MSQISIADSVLEIEKKQCGKLLNLPRGEKVHYIYNPLSYARETHEFYVKRYCCQQKVILFLGMNPGPFGMAQNGVPFGDSHFVKNWLGVKGNVYKPDKEHPKRQVQGLNCSRSEVSGSRFWSFFEDLCIKPENFFHYSYVHNYCPLSMMGESGKNITPPDLKAHERQQLLDICDESLLQTIKLLQVKYIVGVGKFAEERARHVLKNNDVCDITVVGLMHPSPINPAANRGWKDIAYKQLESHGLMCYLMPNAHLHNSA